MDNASVAPTVVPLDLLQEITNGFSEERKLGSGSFGKVYEGIYHDGKKIAVKMLYDMPGLDNEQFQNEFKNLSRLRHKNIVRLIGYCHDIKEVQIKYEGKLVIAEKIHRALCLEYMSNGSLDKYLSDECDRYDWQTGYGIIKGICHGLKYLHNELKPPIYHLDLKPANVLLDENMVPRIADFGMSRLFRDEQTRATKSSLGTIGYLPPEYIKKGLISSKFDIFSLGVVIIKIMAGRAGYFNSAEVSSQEFINLVQKNWTKRLVETLNRKNAYSEQVKICIEIGLSCVQEDRHKRPAIEEIVRRLEETETRCAYAARKDWLLVFQGEKRRTATEEPSDSGPTTPLPDKKLLVFILDRLQKKDTYGVFSEPVDDEELPDYKDIVKHPMDFSTVRKKLDKGAYGNLEQFEDDVFLITSNAMCYNSSDTVYYRQARAIQEVAKKDFENLRQDSDASEPETEPLPEPEPKPQRRRGRPPKNAVQPKVERPPAERATADFSRATLTAAANSGIHAHSGYDIQQRIADVLKASFANRSSEHNWASGHKLGSIEDYSGSGSKWSGKMGKNPLPVEESRRTTYYQHQQSSSIYELPSSYNGTRKLLVPIGVQLQQSYPNSLARFAAQLGPVGWEVASKRIELAIPSGMTFGRGWVGTEESPNTFQRTVPTSSPAAVTPPSSTVASSDQHTVDDPASATHSAGPHPRIDSQAVPSMQCGSVPQVSVDRDEQAVEMKSSHNVHEWPAKHQTVNGFNAVPGSVMFAPPAQLVASRMQTHTAD